MKKRLSAIILLLSLSPVLALGDAYGDGNWGHHMGFMGWGNGMRFMSGGWMMILWIVLLVYLVISIGKWLFGKWAVPQPVNETHSTLAQRFARGEISKEEFLEMKKRLK